MFSPYEELEYIADYLPEEGETVLVSRESGELVCKPWGRGDLRDGIDDAELYGFLVKSNEQLSIVGSLPLWAGVLSLVWLAIFVHGIVGLGWEQWFLVPGISFLTMYGCFQWIRQRQAAHFRAKVLPMLMKELEQRRIPYLALVAGVRQHGELRTLLDEMVRFTPGEE